MILEGLEHLINPVLRRVGASKVHLVETPYMLILGVFSAGNRGFGAVSGSGVVVDEAGWTSGDLADHGVPQVAEASVVVSEDLAEQVVSVGDEMGDEAAGLWPGDVGSAASVLGW